MNKQYILNEIKRTAKGNDGKPLGMDRFRKETGIRRADWLGKYWARWGDAVTEAGYKPNVLQGPHEDGDLIEKMISLIRELGKYPVSAELRLKAEQDKNFPGRTIGDKRNKADFARKIIECCGDKEGYGDVVEICRPIADGARHESASTKEKELVAGYVYLMKSGRNYKIGRSNAPGRREYELRIQLPEKSRKVHEIKTDDPAGIEAYWHKRFQDKRLNGEWFELTPEDVAAFKRRKFM